MKNINDADKEQSSGLLLGSEPLRDVEHRSAAKKDSDDSGKDSTLGDKGDDDASDTDKTDTDTTDKSDTDSTDKKDKGDDSADAAGRD